MQERAAHGGNIGIIFPPRPGEQRGPVRRIPGCLVSPRPRGGAPRTAVTWCSRRGPGPGDALWMSTPATRWRSPTMARHRSWVARPATGMGPVGYPRPCGGDSDGDRNSVSEVVEQRYRAAAGCEDELRDWRRHRPGGCFGRQLCSPDRCGGRTAPGPGACRAGSNRRFGRRAASRGSPRDPLRS